LYVLVRKDLSRPQQAVQACHAAIEATRKFLSAGDAHPHLVLCGVSDETTLEREQGRLEAYGVRTVSFREPDRNNELTAVATEPLTGEAQRRTRRYELLEDE
jgi:hypothetical protein